MTYRKKREKVAISATVSHCVRMKRPKNDVRDLRLLWFAKFMFLFAPRAVLTLQFAFIHNISNFLASLLMHDVTKLQR